MSYHTIAIDPEGSSMAHADEVLNDLDEVPERANEDTFVVVATHGHYDEPGLEQALRSSARYIGLVASRKRSEAVLKNLRGRGFDDDVLGRLKVPAGLDIGAKRGDEIALSIMAEIVQLRRSPDGGVDAEAGAAEATAGSCCGGGK